TSAVFDATPGGTFQNIAGGNTIVGATGNGVGASGVVLTSVQGDLSFSDLDIVADGGAGLRASSTTAYTGSAGLQLAINASQATVAATGGPAVDLAFVAMNTLQMSTVTSTNSATTGIALNSVTGTFSAPSGSAISNITSGAGTGFQVGNSNATITWNGTINNALGKGVDLTTNTGSTISFPGTLTLTSGTN